MEEFRSAAKHTQAYNSADLYFVLDTSLLCLAGILQFFQLKKAKNPA